MKTYVLDANALTRFLARGPGWEKLRELFERALAGEVQLVMSVVNRGEALYVLARDRDFDEVARDLRSLGKCVDSVPATEEDSEMAARLKHRYKMGLGDTYAASLALRLNATLVTADPEFSKLGKQLKILSLPRHAEHLKK